MSRRSKSKNIGKREPKTLLHALLHHNQCICQDQGLNNRLVRKNDAQTYNIWFLKGVERIYRAGSDYCSKVSMKAHQRLTVVIKLGTEVAGHCSETCADESNHLGSSSIIDEKTHQPILSVLSSIVETAVKLRKDGHRVVIVSSGAIAVGLRRMDIEKKPKVLARIQVEHYHLAREALTELTITRHSQLLGNVGS